jgi:ATP-dependent Lon protease
MAISTGHGPDRSESGKARIYDSIAVLPVRNLIIYPHMAAPLVANRSGSVKALDEALQGDSEILILAQRDPDVDAPQAEDLYNTGTLSMVHKSMKLPPDGLHVLVQGVSRMKVI